MPEEMNQEVNEEKVEVANEDEEVVENTEEVEETTEDHEKEIAALNDEINKWKTDYYKVFADMENTRKRLNKEHENQVKFAMQSFIEELLPVIDNFERSLNVETNSEEAQNYLKGMQMIHDQLMNILGKNGVEVIEAKGKPFDPNYHQAVMTEHDDTQEENIVLEELQRGYMLKGRVIRATLVKVNQ